MKHRWKKYATGLVCENEGCGAVLVSVMGRRAVIYPGGKIVELAPTEEALDCLGEPEVRVRAAR